MTMPATRYTPRDLAKARFDEVMNQPLGEGPNPNGDDDHQEGVLLWMGIAAIEFFGLAGWFCMWVFS